MSTTLLLILYPNAHMNVIRTCANKTRLDKSCLSNWKCNFLILSGVILG